MAKKLKRTAQNKEAPAVKSTKTFLMKKHRKKKDINESFNSTRKYDLEKPSTSDEIAKNIFTNKQNSKKKKNHGSKNKLIKFDVKDAGKLDVPTKGPKNNKNKFDVNDTERLDVPTKGPKDNKNKFDVNDTERLDVPTKRPKDNKKFYYQITSEVIQKIPINTNDKTKRKKNKQRQNMNFDHANKDAARVDAKERKKKLQMPAKESIELERRQTKVEKLKKLNEKKMKQMSGKAEMQQMKFNAEILKLNKQRIKIKELEELLARKLQKKKTSRDKMIIQSQVSKFRLINEMLYNNSSSQSKRYFKEDPDAFKAYHAGYNWQLSQWMNDPLDVIISSIMELPIDYVIADFGCGEARLAASVPHIVHSFDFIALNNRVKTCDITHTSLRMNSVHVVVFCLSLMGSESNLKDYMIEANRVLKINGILKIAETQIRFEDVRDFIKLLRTYGFKNIWKDFSDNLFCFMDFKKKKDINQRETLPAITLNSYKNDKILFD